MSNAHGLLKGLPTPQHEFCPPDPDEAGGSPWELIAWPWNVDIIANRAMLPRDGREEEGFSNDEG